MSTSNPYEAKPAVFDSAYDGGTSTTEEKAPEAPEKSQVPAGTVKEILTWVGEDTERAQEALDAEIEGADRATLVKALKDLLDA